MTNRRIAAVDDSTSGLRTAAASAPPKPLAVTLGAFVEAVTELTDDIDEIVAVINHVLRTRAVPLGDLAVRSRRRRQSSPAPQTAPAPIAAGYSPCAQAPRLEQPDRRAS